MSTAGDGGINAPPEFPAEQVAFPTPSLTVVLTTVLLILFFVGLFSIYFCRFFLDSLMDGWNAAGRIPYFTDNAIINHNSIGGDGVANPEEQGLDPALVQLFPTFPYSSVKEFRREKHELECIICLAEFEEDDLLRLLTVCYHVFHPDCIDLWLRSHKTCPVCRRDLEQVSRDSLEKVPLKIFDSSAPVENVEDGDDGSLLDGSTAITVDQDRCLNGGGDDEETGRRKRVESDQLRRFSRSHSTGHSIVVSRSSVGDHGEDEDDRYTLRLMENVKVRMVSASHRHCAVESCIAFGEYSGIRNTYNKKKSNDIGTINGYCGGFGEVSGTSITGIVSKS
ncbi:unnamed protein product [Linum tenue]|uniref:RING-type E3 ubiquitin transferase n=2 Tax=Linum tenue TaxID=586396 RepID=A0AAV0K8A8_9ROSI|nr:unnamed protein product [Linum tenue]